MNMNIQGNITSGANGNEYVSKSGDTMTGKLTIKSGGIESSGANIFSGWTQASGGLSVLTGDLFVDNNYSLKLGAYSMGTYDKKFLLSNEGRNDYISMTEYDDGTTHGLQIDVHDVSAVETTSVQINNGGAIKLSKDVVSGGSATVSDVRVSGISNGTEDNDAVNVKQLNLKQNADTAITTSNISQQKVSSATYATHNNNNAVYTPILRDQGIYASDTKPTANGIINWTIG